MEIRHPTADDVPALAAVHVQSWRDAYDGLLPDDLIASVTVERRTVMWERITESHATNAWLAAVDGQVVGLASIGPAREPEGWGQLQNIYVLGSAWGKGVGTALWDAAQQGLTDRGYAGRQLYVLDTNARARGFYERQGWVHDGTVLMDDSFGEPIREVRYLPA